MRPGPTALYTRNGWLRYLKKYGSLRTAPVPKEKTGRKREEPGNFNVDDDTLPATQFSEEW